MKKFLLLFPVLMIGLKGYCQSSATIGIQYYVDANNNCTYNPGEQLIYNVPTSISYSLNNSTVLASVNTFSFTSCLGQTLYCSNAFTPATNTLIPMGVGITPNLACGSYSNLPYNTNTTLYLPVMLTGTSNLGVQMGSLNYFSSTGGNTYQNVASGGTIGLCANLGTDSMSLNLTIFNLLSCNVTNTLSSRTYSFYFDNVLYDQFTVTSGIFSYNFASGVNNNVNGSEFYTSSNTYLNVNPDFPPTFSVVGTHTFAIKSSMIYNNAASAINYVLYLNSIPCAKITGRFYNDCNNNCIYDTGDSYGVGQNATGLIYNGNGANVTFNPNPFDGKFSVYLPATSAYSLTQYPTTSPGNYTACLTSTITIPAAATTNTFLFGYKNNMPVNVDPGVYLYRVASTSTVISPLVGITFGYQVTNYMASICNNASLPNPGKLKITLPKFINYVSTLSGLTPTFSAGSTIDTLIYAIPNFTNNNTWWYQPLGTFSAVVSATAIANTPFSITASISPSTDTNPQNNIYSWQRTIGGPFDPNGKYTQVSSMKPNGDIPLGTLDFIYEIGFQNIGNAPAINVMTLDTIDANFDLASLRILQSSFPVSLQKDNVSRTVGFHFKNIFLPGAQINEPGSHGFVRYSIKLKPNVPVNTVLKNRAHNYFDFLEPVATNQTNNKLVTASAIDEKGRVVSNVRAIPNPFRSQLSIESVDEINNIKVYNLAGQLLLDVGNIQGTPVINMENFSPGVYLLKVYTKTNEVSIIKVIKE